MFDAITLFRLITASLLPVLVAVGFYQAEKKASRFGQLSNVWKQTIIGVTFGIIGKHNGWASDNVMTYDETLNAYVIKNLSLNGGFKIRGNKNWNSGYNFGAISNSTITVGKGMPVQNSGSSGDLKVAPGTYDVYFSYAKDMVWVMNVGEVPADL